MPWASCSNVAPSVQCYFSPCCEKSSCPKQPKEERVYVYVQFQVTAHHGREVWWQELEVTGHI